MSDVTLFGVRREEVRSALADCGPLLERVLTYGGGRYKLDDVARACEAGDMQMFVARRQALPCGIMVTQIVKYPHRTVLELCFLAGVGIHDLLKFEDSIMRFAHEAGADDVEIVGRIGWCKVLGPEWSMRAVVLKREVPH